MKYINALIFCFFACLGCDSLMAQPKNDRPPSVATEQERLHQERKSIESGYALKEAACYKNFSVNPCIDSARIEKNAALAENKRRELLLNDLQREEKQKKSALKTPKSMDSNPASIDTVERKPFSEKKMDEDKRLEAAKARAEKAGQKKLESQTKARQRSVQMEQSATQAAKYQKKLDEATQHKIEVEKKNTNNTKPKASSLPIPKTIEN
jgi:colicin import membrane protein